MLLAPGDGLLDSLCSHLDMQPLLVRRGTALSSSSPLAGLFVLHFPPLSPSATHRDPIVCDDEESSDELQLLERETLGGRKVRLTLEQKQQLTLESALLSTLLELLKSKTAFKSFMATQLAQSSSGTRSRNRLINLLCRRLILEVSEGDGEFKDYEDLEGESVEFGKPFNMLNIKLQVGQEKYYHFYAVVSVGQTA